MFCGVTNSNVGRGHLSQRESMPVRRQRPARGFTLLEMMVVIVIIMILASVAASAYQQHLIQAREAVLRENLQTLNRVIQEYTLDTHKAPQTLDDLKTAGYLHDIPVDPITRQADWEVEQEDTNNAADPQEPGIVRVHSSSGATGSDGRPYNAW